MKTLFLCIIFLRFSTLNANELKWVDQQIAAIKPPRTGVKMANIAKIKDPFIFTKTTKPLKKKALKPSKIYHKAHKRRRYPLRRLHLTMTMNNSAKINGKWYKVGAMIHGYKIADIKLSSVMLMHHKKSYVLSTYSKKTIKFKN